MRITLFLALFVLLITNSVSGQNPPSTLDPLTSNNVDRIINIAELEVESSVMLADRIVWSPDGESLVIVTLHEALLYSAQNLGVKPDVLFQSDRELAGIALNEDFELMAISSGLPVEDQPISTDNTVQIIDLTSNAIVADFQMPDRVAALAFAADDTRLITVDAVTFNFSLWDIPNSRLIAEYDTDQPGFPWMISAVFNQDATFLALGSGGAYNTATIWDTQTGALITQDVYSSQLTFSPDNAMLAGSSRYGGWTQLWRFADNAPSPIIEFASHYTLAADFSHYGSVFAQILVPVTKPYLGKIQFVDAQTGDEIYRVLMTDEPALESRGMDIIFSPDGKRLAIYNAINGIQIWGVPSND